MTRRGRRAAKANARPEEVESRASNEPAPEPRPAPASTGGRVGDFPLLIELPPPGLVGRYFTTQKHTLGLIFGGLAAWVRSRHAPYPRGYRLARSRR